MKFYLKNYLLFIMKSTTIKNHLKFRKEIQTKFQRNRSAKLRARPSKIENLNKSISKILNKSNFLSETCLKLILRNLRK